ncbi:N-glycosylase/DNA lyase isoform X2 [Callorhinchus milii]|uniref:N-glycosylase/DNA lyase isoform X2 n=1 Tax=Callorhinchus milii TaxID=7868 RepID=UPI001C3FAF27|nr:N-glycosylase/DNA lyase isoform X2 [Callorhinchus milii]
MATPGRTMEGDAGQRHLTLSVASADWHSIPCPQSELSLDIVLSGAQSFRWQERSCGHWTGVLAGRVWTLTQVNDRIWYRTYHRDNPSNGSPTAGNGSPTDGNGSPTDGNGSPTADNSSPTADNSSPTAGNGSPTAGNRSPTAVRKKRRKAPSTNRVGRKMKKEIKREIEAAAGMWANSRILCAVKLEPGHHGTPLSPVKQEPDTGGSREQDILTDYFQLSVSLADLYSHWSRADKNFQRVAPGFPGVRVLRQEPTECLFSFICTTNNQISRITAMIERLCQVYGERLCQLDSVTYYSFPTLASLAGTDVVERLRDLGFGYRAEFISQSARLIVEQHGSGWLQSLRTVPYEEAKRALCTLPGVGAKVADCVCLMSLDKPEAVPVDTHIWQIAKRDYAKNFGGTQKSLTNKVYRDIGDFFRSLWGPFAGWTQAVLFCSDLKKFQEHKSEQGPQSKTKRS